MEHFQLQTLNQWPTHGFSYDDAAEELTRFANQVVRSQEDFTSWRKDTHTRLDKIHPEFLSINTFEKLFFFFYLTWKLVFFYPLLQFVFVLAPIQNNLKFQLPPELESRMRTGWEQETSLSPFYTSNKILNEPLWGTRFVKFRPCLISWSYVNSLASRLTTLSPTWTDKCLLKWGQQCNKKKKPSCYLNQHLLTIGRQKVYF